MLDLGWSELLIIGVAALIVVGPKDLPRLLRTLGQYAGKARSIAREFQRSMDEAARQADIDELKDLKKGLDDMRDAQYKMQRDMGVSLTESSGKAKPKASEGAATAAPDATPAASPPAPAPAPASSSSPGPALAEPAAAPSLDTGDKSGA